MLRIVFLPYHGTGHFNKCFHLAKELKKYHTVIFAGNEYFKKYVALQDFEYYSFKSVPFGMNLENWVSQTENKKFIWWHSLKARWANKLYQHREEEFHQLIKIFQPDCILLDSCQASDFIILHPLMRNKAIRFGFIHIMLPTILQHNEPPINSLAMPDDFKTIKKDQLLFRWKKWRKHVAQKFKYVGKDDQHLIQSKLRLNKIPEHYIHKNPAIFGLAFKNIPEFILAPRAFDFPQSKRSQLQHYLGFQIDYARIEIADADFITSKELFYKNIKAQKSKLIYCSFGTLPAKNYKLLISFLQKIVRSLKDSSHTLLLSVTVTEIEKDNLLRGNDHVYIFKTLPQLEILSKADVFITHGGLNSILESIDAGVPMIVFPSDSRTDHAGNGARVVFHKLGLLIDPSHTSTNLRDKIEELLNDSTYKQNLVRFKNTNPNPINNNKLIENMPSAWPPLVQ